MYMTVGLAKKMIDILYISKKSCNFVAKFLMKNILTNTMLMKRLILSILVLTLALGVNAKNYLISSEATTDSTTINYKGGEYVVGVDAFANLAALLNASPEANSNVYVAPGTYSEAITINVNGLKFYGNNANCESRSKNRNTAESIITGRWTIAANNIVVNGFTLQGNGQMYEWDARNGKAISGFKFLYNIVTSSTVAKNAEYGVLQFGHYAGGSEAVDTQWQNRYQNFEVKHNVFSGSAQNKANFVSISGAFGTTSIEDNTFTDGGTSIYLNNGNGTMNIKNNTFKNVGDTNRIAQGSTYGEFCISMRYCCKSATNIYIQNNVFNNCQGQGSMYCLIRFFNGDKSNAIMPLATSRLYMNYNIFTKKPLHSSRDYNYIYYSNDEYTGSALTVDCRFNEYDNSELCIGTVYLPSETTAGRVFASSMGEFNFASSAGTTADYFVSPCGTTIKSQSMKSTRVCQSFDIDETTDDMYFLQIDPNNGAKGYEPQTVTRYYKKSDGTTGKQYMYLGNAAHGSNLAVCRMSDGKLYLFTGGNSETSKSTSRAICIFPFVSGATADLQKTSFTHSGKTYTIKQMTSGNGHTNQYPSIDKQNRLLCECSRSSNYMYFVIYDLDDAFNNLGNATKLKSIKIQKLTNPFSSSSNPQYGDTDQGYMYWPFQGFTINGDYIYQAEGMGGGTNGLDGYETVTYEGKNLPIVMLNAYNWRTNKWAYRKPVMKSAIINMSHGEPEGWKMRRGAKGRTNMYLQIANGASGSRNNNVFEYVADVVNGYKYKVPAVTVTPSVTNLTYNTTSLDAVAQTVKLTNDYLLGGFYAVITGEDAADFLVQYATTNKHGKVWDTKTDVKVTFTPKEGKTNYKAVLRISTPNATDIVIPIQATYTAPTPPTPPTPTTPDSVHYELNGGELPKAAEVPTNDSLWTAFKPYYNTFYGLNRADQPITEVTTFAAAKMCEIMTAAESEYKWLGDYITEVAAAQAYILTSDTLADGMEALWRWHVHSFFNCNQRTDWPQTADFTEAGQPEAWGPAYQEVYGTAVVLPAVITETFVLPTPVKEGYTFGGWYWETDFSGTPVTQLEVGAHGTLYAKWVENVVDTPDPEPAVMNYELNGGELPKAADVPTNDSLWTTFKVAYKSYYNYSRAFELITEVSSFLYGGALNDSLSVKHMLVDATSGWKWLGDYIIDITSSQSQPLESESNWRWNVHAFFNCNDGTKQGNQAAESADYSVVGKPEAWGTAYQKEYGEAVVLPTIITGTYVLPEPTKDGYNFGGWYWEADFVGTPVTELHVGDSGTLYAKWNAKQPGTPTSLDLLNIEGHSSAVKFLYNGKIVIVREGQMYDMQGRIIL